MMMIMRKMHNDCSALSNCHPLLVTNQQRTEKKSDKHPHLVEKEEQSSIHFGNQMEGKKEEERLLKG